MKRELRIIIEGGMMTGKKTWASGAREASLAPGYIRIVPHPLGTGFVFFIHVFIAMTPFGDMYGRK